MLHVHVGAARHGVTRFGRVVSEHTPDTVSAVDAHLRGSCVEDPERLERAIARHRPQAVVFQFTHQLYGREPLPAAERFCVVRAAAGDLPVLVVLHDVPPPTGDVDRLEAYARVAASADAVAVCSRHEAGLVARLTGSSPAVVPHFVLPRPLAHACGRHRRGLGVLGFLYPGKGHEEVIDAASRMRPPPEVVALGGPAPLHRSLPARLRADAAEVGVRFAVTGWLDDAVLDRRLAAVAVPVVANCGSAASGSLSTWLGAGRRPLVRSSPYSREVAELAPGCVQLYDPGDPELLAELVLEMADGRRSSVHPCVPEALHPTRTTRRMLALVGLGR